jgi:hypothetical protein
MKQPDNKQSTNYTYQQLEKEVNDRHKKLTATTWRGNLSKEGLKMVSWGDLRELEVK